MGFKMKGASLHQGTDGHKKAVEAKKAENKANLGEGFMRPPYKKQVGPTEKRSGYHGYKNSKSNLDSKQEKAEDAKGVGTNVKTRKVMKDGYVNPTQKKKIADEKARFNALSPKQKKAEQDAANDKADKFHKRGKYAPSPNKMHAKGHKGKKTHEDYLDEGFSQVEADQMMRTGASTGEYTPKKKGKVKAKAVAQKKAKKKDTPVKPKPGDMKKYSDLEKYDDDNPTGKASPAKQKWLNRAPEGFDWKGARAKAKAAVKNEGFRRDLSKFPTSRSTADGVTGAAASDAAQKSGEIYGKDKVKKGVKKVAKKIIKKPGKILKTVGKALKVGGRLLGPASLGVMAYDAYKFGQKHSGGKIDPNQKQVIKEGKKKSGGSIMAQGKKRAGSIYKK